MSLIGDIQSDLDLLKDLVDGVKTLNAWFQKAETDGWFRKLDEDFRSLEMGPTTGSQKDDAAKAIASDINKL